MAEESTPQVLVIDDDPTVRRTVAFLLTSAGYGVSTAADGFDALLQLRKISPDLIVSDLNMPKCRDSSFSPWFAGASRRFRLWPSVAPTNAGSPSPAESLPTAFMPKASPIRAPFGHRC